MTNPTNASQPAAPDSGTGSGSFPNDRRKRNIPVATDRRRSDRRGDPPVPDQYRAGARHMNEYPLLPEEMEFINAINAYKTKHSRPFPTWSEVLHVLKALGYRKADASEREPESP